MGKIQFFLLKIVTQKTINLNEDKIFMEELAVMSTYMYYIFFNNPALINFLLLSHFKKDMLLREYIDTTIDIQTN